MEIRNHVYHFAVEPKLTGKRIKELRKERNMTAQNLADALLCSVKTVSSWETGARFPSIDNLVDLSNFFDVSVHSLMLPLDNCPAAFVDIRPYDGNVWNYAMFLDYNVRCDSDEIIAALLKRDEYLLQRMLADVFTNENECEHFQISFDLNYRLAPPKDPKCNFKFENTADAFWTLKKECTHRENMRYIIFNRILHGENLDQTLQAMDLFERSVFLTMLCFFPELRAWDCAKVLYESGARFIDCHFNENLNEIKKGSAAKIQDYLFNIAYYTFEDAFSDSETCIENVLAFYHDVKKLPEGSKNRSFYETNSFYTIGERRKDKHNRDSEGTYWFYFDVTEILKHSDNLSFHKGKKFRMMGEDCKDPSERKKLGEYYYLFDFIVNSVKSLEDFGNRMIAGNECFDIYMEELIKRGLIQNEQ